MFRHTNNSLFLFIFMKDYHNEKFIISLSKSYYRKRELPSMVKGVSSDLIRHDAQKFSV